MKTWLRQNSLPLLVVVIGLCTSVGYLTNSTSLMQVGVLSAASPIPIPFTDMEGTQHNFAYRYELSAELTDGSVITTPIFIEDFLGPHRRIVTYELAIIMWQHSPFMMNTVLGYMCEGKQLHPAIPADGTVAKIIHQSFAPGVDDVSAQTITVACSHS